MTNGTPEDYERELERDRARLGRTVDELQQRLSPGQLLDQALQYAKSGGSEAASVLVHSAKRNPWPLVLTGVGLAWLMASTASGQGRNGDAREDRAEGHYPVPAYPGYGTANYPEDAETGERRSAIERAQAAAAEVQRRADEAEDAFQARLTEAKARALSLKQDAEETAEAFKDRVEGYLRDAQDRLAAAARRSRSAMDRTGHAIGETARGMADRARDMADRTRDLPARARSLYDSEPLIAGAIGVVAGTLLGALLPTTETEDRLFGEYGREARHQAAELASAAGDAASAAAAEGAKAAARTAEEAVRGERPDEVGGEAV